MNYQQIAGDVASLLEHQYAPAFAGILFFVWGVANLGKLTPNIGAMPENKKKAINKKIRFIADASIVLFFVLLFLTVVSQGTQVIPEGPTIKDIYTVVNFGLAIFVIFLVILSTYELGKSHGKLDNPAESYFRKLIYLFEVYKLRGVSFSRLFWTPIAILIVEFGAPAIRQAISLQLL